MNTFNLESKLIESTNSALKVETQGLTLCVLALSELGVEETKKVIKAGYDLYNKETKNESQEARTRRLDARNKYTNRRIKSASVWLENESVQGILANKEQGLESVYNNLQKFLKDSKATIITPSKEKLPATDEEVIARFVQAYKACLKRGLVAEALNQCSAIESDDIELAVNEL